MEVVVIGGSGVIGSKVVAKQATEMLGEGAEDAAEVPPAGDAGTGAVQEQQGEDPRLLRDSAGRPRR